MDNTDDEKLRELMHQMMDVPFSDDLKERILTKASSVNEKPKKRNRQRFRTFRFGAVAAGLFAAAALAFMVTNPRVTKTDMNSAVIKSGSNQTVTAYGFQNAPLRVDNLHLGAESGYPDNSEVVATLTNETSKAIHAGDVFGILAFSKTRVLQNLADADWISFVNGPSKGQSIQPHGSMKWVFQPIGAPHSETSALTETPHLMFYSSKMVSPGKADVSWRMSSVQVVNTSVVLNTKMHTFTGNGQSFIVEADFKNTMHKPIDLSHLLCFIWFDQNDSHTFATFGTMRFITHVPLGAGSQSVLEPGKTMHVAFHLIGSAEGQYFTNTAHVVVLNAP